MLKLLKLQGNGTTTCPTAQCRRLDGLHTLLLLAGLSLTVPAITVSAQGSAASQSIPSVSASEDTNLNSYLAQLQSALIALPVATVLGAALALRPRRRGTPKRSSAVIQTQIVLTIIGALVMLVVGASLARAFGIVGAAGLIRYRAKIDNPKDAVVMLSTLAIGLAAGVGLYVLSLFAALFIMGVLWVIESFEPGAYKLFTLNVTSKDATQLQPQVEHLLRRERAKFELRTSSPDEICFEVQLPIERKTDALSNSILALNTADAVEWDEHKQTNRK